MPSTPTRRIKVTVNGKAYVVEVGDMSVSPTAVTVNGRPYLVNIEAAAPEKTPMPVGPAGPLVTQVKAPMPGNILDIAVKPGDRVSFGQQLCALEAMKMKSAIRSPRDGIVATVTVTPGQTVAHGAVLITFE